MKINENLKNIEYLNDAIKTNEIQREIVDIFSGTNDIFDFKNSYDFPTSENVGNCYGKKLSQNVYFVSQSNTYWAGGDYDFLQIQNSSDLFRIKTHGNFTIKIKIASSSSTTNRDIILKTVNGKVLDTQVANACSNFKEDRNYTNLTFNVENIDEDVIIASQGGSVRIRTLEINYLTEKTDRKLMIYLNPETFYLNQVETYSLIESARDTSTFSGTGGYTYFTVLKFRGKIKINQNTKVIIGVKKQNDTYDSKVKIFKTGDYSDYQNTDEYLNYLRGNTKFTLVAETEFSNSNEKKITRINENEMNGNNTYYIGIYSDSTVTINVMGFNNEDVAEKINPPFSFRIENEAADTFDSSSIISSYQTFCAKIQTLEENNAV